MSDNELPQLSGLFLRPTTKTSKTITQTTTLRRSPRKQKIPDTKPTKLNALQDVPQLFASSQQRRSPQKQPSSRRAPFISTQARSKKTVLEDVPELAPISERVNLKSKVSGFAVVDGDDSIDDDLARLLNPLSQLSLKKNVEEEDAISEEENARMNGKSKKTQPTSTMSRITQVAREQTKRTTTSTRASKAAPKQSNPYVLKEAHCEDLNESSGTDGEDEDTDLSGFIVDDDVELSFHGSAIEISSDESEVETRRRRQRPKKEEPRMGPRRRLVRGSRKQISDSEEDDEADGLSNALDSMKLGERTLEKQKDIDRRKTLEVIDLTSSPVPDAATLLPLSFTMEQEHDSQKSTKPELDPFAASNTGLILQPSKKSRPQFLPSKIGPLSASPARTSKPSTKRPTTPPTTPPRDGPLRPQSPTKLKSPSKLLSPSKRALEAPKSPHRQSMDAFWDHNVINEWTDTFSPKKAPLGSPQRRNPLSRFNLYADDDELSDIGDSQPTVSSLNESSDSLPSPCESPSKSRSPKKIDALQAEKRRIKDLKAAKELFDSEKHQFALDLLNVLDTYMTSSRISELSATTGGIKLIWSKTLRSTAGRANWKRTVTKPSGSPVKGNPNSASITSQPGVVVQHFASIELAEKIIDREERLVNTLAHEFCHLANFMISNIRDQPHGASFQIWGRKATSFLRSSVATQLETYRPAWAECEVTTKHSYVVEHKYLWICVGRTKEQRNMAERFLELDEEEGCGAEYGRHSRSIDTDKQRCGRCKGYLVQVRPTPRTAPASPRKMSPRKKNSETKSSGIRNIELEKLMEAIELSD
ncbi:hypothetical protein H2198_003139 [Neophaeococcomyces mojaviensis]|uniref:Uncharacterized protein n=1 Tax=Neophaeococcomyces mojaviensis TaxID=3383035 RepID=A0ACC3ACF1_9EURO|nr:hypothetical protein H2198_003139 [Knufia sp. JES_112]